MLSDSENLEMMWRKAAKLNAFASPTLHICSDPTLGRRFWNWCNMFLSKCFEHICLCGPLHWSGQEKKRTSWILELKQSCFCQNALKLSLKGGKPYGKPYFQTPPCPLLVKRSMAIAFTVLFTACVLHSLASKMISWNLSGRRSPPLILRCL